MTDAVHPEAADSAGAQLVGTPPFLELLRRCLDERRADGRGLAVLLVDCGLIARIDAVWGYHVGDAVRERVADTLRSDVLRPGDFVGLLGRDDLACILTTVDDPAVPLLAGDKLLRSLNAPLWIGDDEIFTRAAIGIAMYPLQGDAAEVLLQRAKAACIEARKSTGRIALYSDEHGLPLASALLTENRLRTAVAEDALEMVFQPQYDLSLGQIMGAQTRQQWRAPAGGAIAADQAFAAAESAGVVNGLVSSILNHALRNISEFRYSAGLDLRVGVQIPAFALLHADLPEVIQRALGTWSLRPGRLVLQIGATSVLDRSPVAQETLLQLKKIGVRLAIDDPGMALSSLFFLATLPFQEIRLDVSAANAAADGTLAPKAERILGALIELAHQLGLEVVASGVADEAAAARLKALGCDCMQADFKGPALDAKGFVARYG